MGGSPFHPGKFFFSGVGRVGRLRFVLGAAVLIIVFDLYERLNPLICWIAGWVFWPVWIAAACCVLSKRLHDRGRAGWWSGLVLLAFGLVWPWPEGWGEVWLLVLVWALFDLAIAGGQKGFNRFGPPPGALGQIG